MGKFAEEHKKWQEQKRQSFQERHKQWRAENRGAELTANIQSRLKAWADEHDAFVKSYYDRFGGRNADWSYIDYVGDAGDYYKTASEQSKKLNDTAGKLLADLQRDSYIYGDDFVKAASQMLTSGQELYTGAEENAKNDMDFWAMFEPKEEQIKAGYDTPEKLYDAWRTENKYQTKHEGKNRDEIERAILYAEDEQEADWLRRKHTEMFNLKEELARYDPEFEEKSKYKSTRTETRKAYGYEYGIYANEEYEWINGNGDVTSYYAFEDDDVGGYPEWYTRNYDYLTDDQIAVYNYYVNTKQNDKAEEYLNYLQPSLNQQAGRDLAAGLKGNTLAELLFAIPYGFENFKSGMNGLIRSFFGDDTKVPPSAIQYAAAEVREDLGNIDLLWYDFSEGKWKETDIFGSSLGQGLFDFGTTTANMVPSILTSTFVSLINPAAGAVTGTALLSGSAAGNAYQEKINLGYSVEQASAYGYLVGISEGVLQYALGGISKLGKGGLKRVFSSLDKIDNVLARFAKTTGGRWLLSGVSEGFEEGLQSVIEPYIWQAVSGEEAQIDWEETLYNSLIGFMSGSTFEGAEISRQNAAYREIGKPFVKADNTKAIGTITELAKTMDGVSNLSLGKQAEAVSKKPTAKNVGKLVTDISNAVNAQNSKELSARLVEAGFDAKKAEQIADAVITLRSDYESLTRKQMSLLEEVQSDERVLSAIEEVLDTEGSAAYQRNAALQEALESVRSAAVEEKVATDPHNDNAGQAGVNGENVDPLTQLARETVEARYAAEDGVGVDGISAEGRAIYQDQAVDVVDIDKAGGGKVFVKLADGRSVDATTLEYEDSGEAELWRVIGKYAENAEAARALLQEYRNGDLDAYKYARGIEEAFLFGKLNLSPGEMDIKDSMANLLDPAQRNMAYKQGNIAGQKKTQQRQDKLNAAKKKGNDKKGQLHFEGDRGKLTNRQKVSLQTCEIIAKALGIQVYVFESEKGTGTKRVGENGWYDPKDGSIHIDLHAGQNGEGVMVFTLAHELTHFIRDWSPKKFRVLSGFLAEQYAKKGQSVDLLVRQQMKKAEDDGRKLSYEEAHEEWVADSMETMLTDGTIVEKLAMLQAKDKGLVAKIKSFLDGFLKRLKAAYQGVSPQTQEGQIVGEMVDAAQELQDLFADALLDAGESFQTAEKNTTGEGGVRFAKRDTSKVHGDISSFVDKALSGGNHASIQISLATQWDNKAINRLGDPWRGKYVDTQREFDSDHIRHIIKQHGDPIVEALRGQLHMDGAAIKIALSNLRDGKGRVIQGTFTEQGNPSILTEIPINGYTLYAEEPMRMLNGVKLSGRTMFMTPTSSKALIQQNAVNIPRRQSRGLAPSISNTNRIVNDYLTDNNGEAITLNYIAKDGKPVAGRNTQGMYVLSSDVDTLSKYKKEGMSDSLAKVKIKNPYIVSAANPLITTEDVKQGSILDRLAEVKKNGYDAIIMDYKPGDNYIVMLFDAASIEDTKSTVTNGIVKENDSTEKRSSSRSGAVSDRTMLVDLFEQMVTDSNEYRALQNYKKNINQMLALEEKVDRLTEEIKRVSIAEGPRNMEYLDNLKAQRKQAVAELNKFDNILLGLEKSGVLRAMIDRNRQMIQQETRDKVREYYRQKNEAREAEIRQYYRESRRKAVERHEKAQVRQRIRKDVQKLDSLLNKGTKEKNVKLELQEFAGAALRTAKGTFLKNYNEYDMVRNGVNTTMSREQKAVFARCQELLKELDQIREDRETAPAPDNLHEKWDPEADLRRDDREEALKKELAKNMAVLREAGIFRVENELMEDSNAEQLMDELMAAYKSLQDSESAHVREVFSSAIYDHIESVKKFLSGKAIKDMTAIELGELHKMYRLVLHTINTSNDLFAQKRKGDVRKLGEEVISQLQTPGKEMTAEILDKLAKMGWANLKPETALELIGSEALTGMMQGLYRGEDTYALDIEHARKYAEEQGKKYGRNKWKMKKSLKFANTKITLGEAMSLYAYTRRQQAQGHLEGDGFTHSSNVRIKEPVGKLPVELSYIRNATKTHSVPKDVFDRVAALLTTEQKKYVEAMQEYLSKVMGAKGNEVSMQLYGIPLFMETAYFPLKTASEYHDEALGATKGEVKLRNSGFTQKVQEKASNPIVLDDFESVWDAHVGKMSLYHGFVLPMEDFDRVYNYHHAVEEGVTDAEGEVYKTRMVDTNETVKVDIENKMGKAATAYIEDFMRQLNGGVRSDPTEKMFGSMVRNFKKTAVLGSLSVGVQQPMAFIRAMAYLDPRDIGNPKDFLGKAGKPEGKILDEMYQYAPVALMKHIGGFDPGLGRTTKDYVFENKKGIAGALDKFLGKFPEKMDEWTWSYIWICTKRQIHRQNPDLKINSKEFLEKVGERFSKIIRDTQVYDSVLTKSQVMRSKNVFMQMSTAFMNEATTSMDMYIRSTIQAKRGKIKKSQAARTYGAVVGSQILTAAVAAFVYALRDDDEDETYWEKYLSAVIGKTWENTMPWYSIPFVKDIFSVFDGYSVERSDMSLITDFYQGWQKLQSDKASPWEKMEAFAGSVLNVFGIPLKNVSRDVRGIYNTVKTWINGGVEMTGAGLRYAVLEGLTGKKVSREVQLQNAVAENDTKHILRVMASYSSEESATTALRSAVKAAYLQGNVSEEQAAEFLQAYAGDDTADAQEKVTKWRAEKETGVAYDDIKESFISGKITEEQAKEMYITYGGYDEESAEKKVTYWKFKKEHPESELDQSPALAFVEFAEPAGISLDIYTRYVEATADLEGDKDEDGKTIANSKRDKVWAEIHKLPISKKQKDALHYAAGYKESSLEDAPWH